jgi:hypothetical protein
VLAFPWQHAWSSAAIGIVPAPVYEPLARKASLPQIAMLQAEADKAATK